MKSLQKGPTNQTVGERCSENIHRWENAPLMKFKGVDLKNKGQLFYQQKTVFIQEQQRIAIQAMQLRQNHRQVWRTKERTIILQRKGEFGRSFHNTKPLEETGNSKGCGCLSLAGPLPGEGKIFLPPGGVLEQKTSSCWRYKVSSYLGQSRMSGRAPLQALPTPILVDVFLIKFHEENYITSHYEIYCKCEQDLKTFKHLVKAGIFVIFF